MAAIASDTCDLVIDGMFEKADPKLFKSSTNTAELTASVETKSGYWLRDLKAETVKPRGETKTHFLVTYQFRMKGERFCSEDIQVRLDGSCRLEAVSHKGQKIAVNVQVKRQWLPAFNKPSSQRKFKAQLC